MLNKNNRRAFLLLSVVFLIASIVVFTTACSLGGPVEGGGETAAPTVVGIEVTVADGSPLNVQGDRIVMPLGQLGVIANGDLSVVALYSDGAKQTVTDFTVDASSLLSVEAPGVYMPAIETTEIYSVEYSGEEVDIVAKLDENRAEADKIATLLADGKVTVAEGENYTRTATDAGDYVLCLTAAPGCVWGDESTGFVTEQYIGWRVSKKVIPVPTAGETTSFVYTGSEITLPVDLHGFDDVITLSNGGTPTNVAINANQGDSVNLCAAYVRTEYRNNYVFEGNLDAVEFFDDVGCTLGDVIRFRKKDTTEEEYHTLLTGFKGNARVNIGLGDGGYYSLNDLFSLFELYTSNGWRPFGIEE